MTEEETSKILNMTLEEFKQTPKEEFIRLQNWYKEIYETNMHGMKVLINAVANFEPTEEVPPKMHELIKQLVGKFSSYKSRREQAEALEEFLKETK